MLFTKTFKAALKNFRQKDNIGINIHTLSRKDDDTLITWHCHKCQQQWQSTILKRIKHSSLENCPYCYGKVVNESNSLATHLPELMQHWDHENNQPNHPNNVWYKCDKRYFWVCNECQYEYAKPIAKTLKKGCIRCHANQLSSTTTKQEPA